MKNLVYTVAFDPPGSPGHRVMGKLLVASLLRTYFTGDIVVFRNSAEPLFQLERPGLREVYVDTPEMKGKEGNEMAWGYKYLVRKLMAEGLSEYDKVLFLDADSLVLRNIDHLLEGDWDIAFQREARPITSEVFNCFFNWEEVLALGNRNGVNSGTIAVRAEKYLEVMQEWERIDTGPTARTRYCSDQGSWNRLLAESAGLVDSRRLEGSPLKGLKLRPIERDGVMFPLHLHPRYHDYTEASIVHCLGGDTRQKMKFMWGLFMSTFCYDDAGTMLNFLEV